MVRPFFLMNDLITRHLTTADSCRRRGVSCVRQVIEANVERVICAAIIPKSKGEHAAFLNMATDHSTTYSLSLHGKSQDYLIDNLYLSN